MSFRYLIRPVIAGVGPSLWGGYLRWRDECGTKIQTLVDNPSGTNLGERSDNQHTTSITVTLVTTSSRRGGGRHRAVGHGVSVMAVPGRTSNEDAMGRGVIYFNIIGGKE